MASVLRRACPARSRAGLRPDPQAAFRRAPTSSARRTSSSRSWARRATRRPTSSSTTSGPPPSTTSRSAARSSATRRASTRSRSTICTTGGAACTAAAASLLVAAGKVEHERLVELAEARLGELPGGHDRAARAGPLHRRHPGRPTAPPTRPISLWASRRRPSSIPIISRRACSRTSSAAACRRACSSRCARIAGLAYSVYSQLHPLSPIPACSTIYAATARRESGRGRAADRGDRRTRRSRRSPSARSTGSAPSRAPAC